MTETIKIGNAQAFWGDRTAASSTLVAQQRDLDYLTLDYLSEVSMSIMAAQQAKDPAIGYARDFVEVVKSLTPYWKQGSKVKVLANAGGLNPKGCALACAEVLRDAGCRLNIAIVTGDDVLEKIKEGPCNPLFYHMETRQPASTVLEHLTTANAYLGAAPIVNALQLGADIVITGRVADPSLTVAPCIYHFGWTFDNYDCIAQATVAGHLIECGTQATGGISTQWLDLPDPANIGYPVIEMHADGTFVITKPPSTGGRVSMETVKEQLLYEIGDPEQYLSPDATVSFLSLALEQDGRDRIRIVGAKGSPPPPTYKVSATYNHGFKAEAMLVIFGRDAEAKARLCGEIVLERVRHCGFKLQKSCIECLGSGDAVPGVLPIHEAAPARECVLRIAAADHRHEALECFAKEIAPLVTSGPQGTTGYTSGRPVIRQVFGYWPCLIPVSAIASKVELIEV